MSGGDLRPQYGPLALLGDIKGDRWRRGACGGGRSPKLLRGPGSALAPPPQMLSWDSTAHQPRLQAISLLERGSLLPICAAWPRPLRRGSCVDP